MEEEVFKKSKINEKKLIEYGFNKNKNNYTYEVSILNNSFNIEIIYDGKIKGKIIDNDTSEELLNYRVEKNNGEFINTIRNEYIKVLKNIKNKCTTSNNYLYPQSNRISKLINKKYGDIPEYLWEDDTASVYRNKPNKKWYGIIMYISGEKIGNDNRMVEVMNVKLPPEKINKLLEKEGYYKAYHMNKKHWITFILDDSLEDDEIMNLIEISYNFTIKNKK